MTRGAGGGGSNYARNVATRMIPAVTIFLFARALNVPRVLQNGPKVIQPLSINYCNNSTNQGAFAAALAYIRVYSTVHVFAEIAMYITDELKP